MKIQWIINPGDIARVKALVSGHPKTLLVRDRYERNLARTKPPVTKERFWRAMVCMRLTTQQKSGPGSHVSRFQGQQPFPLRYPAITREQHIGRFITKVLKDAGGIRFVDKIGNELAENIRRLEQEKWQSVLDQCNRLTRPVEREIEIEVADYIQKSFLGFGPKQTRNLLQALGLTRFEIPIDSRVTEWLNEFGFPFRLSAAALSDANYYRLVSDGILALCENCSVYPCILDAAIFGLKDGGGWTKKALLY